MIRVKFTYPAAMASRTHMKWPVSPGQVGTFMLVFTWFVGQLFFAETDGLLELLNPTKPPTSFPRGSSHQLCYIGRS
jgi:hypothetical protein